MFCNCIASHCDVMSLSCLCAFVTLNKTFLPYLLTYYAVSDTEAMYHCLFSDGSLVSVQVIHVL